MNLNIKIGIYTPNDEELLFFEQAKNFEEAEEALYRAEVFFNLKKKKK
jgi:hypothetical protein